MGLQPWEPTNFSDCESSYVSPIASALGQAACQNLQKWYFVTPRNEARSAEVDSRLTIHSISGRWFEIQCSRRMGVDNMPGTIFRATLNNWVWRTAARAIFRRRMQESTTCPYRTRSL